MQKLKALGKYSPAITFLAFEFFALMAFNYSGSFVLFGALTLVLTILLVIFNIAEIKKKGLSNVALFFIPLFLFVLLTAFGTYSIAHTKVGDFSYGELVFIPLGILPIAFAGYLLSVDKKFNLKVFLIVIYSALSIYCLINLFYNIVNFGAFYPIIYKNYYLYYGGVRSAVPVNEFAYTLEGFKFIEVDMNHYDLYPILLLSSSVMLMYLSPRKEKKLFITFLLFGLVSILCLVLVPSILSLASIVFAMVLLLVIFFGKKYLKARTVFKWILRIFLILFAVGFVSFIFIHQSFMSGLASNAFIQRLFFTNRYVNSFGPLVNNLFSGDKFLGFAVETLGPGLYEEVHLSGSFLVDSFMTSGVLGALGLFAFIFFGFKTFREYFKSHRDEFRLQATLLVFLVMYVVYISYFDKGEYALYYNVYKPIYLTAPFMIMVFMFSYVISRTKAVEEPKVEQVEEKVEEEQAHEEQI